MKTETAFQVLHVKNLKTLACFSDRLRLLPRVQDVPLLSEVPPGQVPTLRVSTHVDDDINHILLWDQVRSQRQVQQPWRHKEKDGNVGMWLYQVYLES